MCDTYAEAVETAARIAPKQFQKEDARQALSASAPELWERVELHLDKDGIPANQRTAEQQYLVDTVLDMMPAPSSPLPTDDEWRTAKAAGGE